MPVVRRFSYLCCVVAAVTLMGGCTTVKKVSSSVGHGVSSFWTDVTTEDEKPVAESDVEEVTTEAPAPEPLTEPIPEPAPEPLATPEPEPEAAPMVETEPPLPPGGPVIFEDEQPTVAAPAPPTELEIYEVMVPEGNYVFVPRLLTIYEGDTVVWKNTSGLVHLFASIPGSDPSGTMEIEPVDLLVGDNVQHTFTTAGTYPYFCFIHNRMTGKIVVLPR
jgi:plastocyanin